MTESQLYVLSCYQGHCEFYSAIKLTLLLAQVANPSVAALYEDALVYETGSAITSSGALSAYSGSKTGRSPSDKRIVEEDGSAREVWWGPVNRPMSQDVCEKWISLQCSVVWLLEFSAACERRFGMAQLMRQAGSFRRHGVSRFGLVPRVFPIRNGGTCCPFSSCDIDIIPSHLALQGLPTGLTDHVGLAHQQRTGGRLPKHQKSHLRN
jgi:hypothetical protein